MSLSGRKSRDVSREAGVRSPMKEDREAYGIREVEGEDAVEAAPGKASRGKSRRGSSKGRGVETETEKKAAGRSFLRFGSGRRSRAKKNAKAVQVEEEPAQQYEAEREDEEDEPVRHGHHGYSEGYDVYPGRVAEDELEDEDDEDEEDQDEEDQDEEKQGRKEPDEGKDEKEDEEEEDVYDKLHATYQTNSAVTGSNREFYSVD